MNVVVKAIVAQVELLDECANNKKEYQIIRAGLTTMLRKWCDTLSVSFVSVNANNAAHKLGIDLFEKQWKDQPKFDKGRHVFHLEHKYPISDMISDMEAGEYSVAQVLARAEFGWILKEEDKRLISHNRDDHDLLYAKANIHLLRS